LHRFWNIASCWSKIAVWTYPTSIWRHHLGWRVTPLEFRLDSWLQKTGYPGLSYGVVCVIQHLSICNAGLWQIDGQTDRQTDDDIYRASIASRGKMYVKCLHHLITSVIVTQEIYYPDNPIFKWMLRYPVSSNFRWQNYNLTYLRTFFLTYLLPCFLTYFWDCSFFRPGRTYQKWLYFLGYRFYGCLKCILCLVVLPCWCFVASMCVMCQFMRINTIRYDIVSDGT